MMKYFATLLFTFISMSLFLQASVWNHYMAARSVNSITCQDQYIWIGSESGLSRHSTDGSQVVNYTFANSDMPFEAVSCSALDTDGNLWIGSRGGIAQMIGDTWHHYPFNVANMEYIKALDIASYSNSIWVSTANALAHLEGNNWTFYNSDNSPLPGYSSRGSLCFDNDNRLWLGTSQGLFSYDNGIWHEYSHSGGNFPVDSITDLYLDHSGTLWACSPAGLIKRSGTVWTIYNTSNSEIASNNILSIAETNPGDYWIGSDQGLIKMHDNDWAVFNSSNSNIPFDLVERIACAENGEVWCGTHHAFKPMILCKYDQTAFQGMYPTGVPLTENEFNTIQQIADGKIWFGTSIKDGGGAALCFDGADWHHYSNYNTAMTCPCAHAVAADDNGNTYVATCFDLVVINDQGSSIVPQDDEHDTSISAMTIDQDQNLWVGRASSPNSISMYDGNSWTHHSADIGLIPGKPIKADSEGNIWLATYFNLVCFDGDDWVEWSVNSGDLFQNRVTDICFDDEGNTWIANGALGCYHDGSWTYYTAENSPLSANDVSSVFMDENSRLWIGTYHNGFYCKDGDDWQAWNSSNAPIYPDIINRIMMDRSGRLWLGFYQTGLVTYDTEPVSNHDASEPEYVSPIIYNYPNPFYCNTSIKYEQKDHHPVDISIFNIKGQLVRNLGTYQNSPGVYQLDWDAVDHNGRHCAAGIYFLQIKSRTCLKRLKMLLIK